MALRRQNDWNGSIRPEWLEYIRANSGGRVPEGVEEGLQRMSLTAYLAGDEGAQAAVNELITPVQPIVRKPGRQP